MLSLVVAALALLAAACGSGAEQVSTEDVEQLFQEPEEFVGQEVRVQGNVAETIGDVGFRLENPEGEGDPVLVITSGEQMAEISQEDVLDVVGTVRELDPQQVAEQLGGEIDTSQLEQFAGQPAIIAEELTPASGG